MEINIEEMRIDTVRDRMKRFPETARNASSISLNLAIRQARMLGIAELRKQIAFPSSYFPNSPYDGKLRISQNATPQVPEAVLTARHQPTSLGRFVVEKDSKGRNLRIRIRPGSVPKKIGNAFIVRLRRGRILDDNNFNLGVAIRLKPGQSIRGSRTAKAFSNGLALLYGPSVDQAFKSVRNDIASPVARSLASNFVRQFERLYRG